MASLGFDATPETAAAVFTAGPSVSFPSIVAFNTRSCHVLSACCVQAFDLKGDGRVSCWEFTRGLHNLQAQLCVWFVWQDFIADSMVDAVLARMFGALYV